MRVANPWGLEVEKNTMLKGIRTIYFYTAVSLNTHRAVQFLCPKDIIVITLISMKILWKSCFSEPANEGGRKSLLS